LRVFEKEREEGINKEHTTHNITRADKYNHSYNIIPRRDEVKGKRQSWAPILIYMSNHLREWMRRTLPPIGVLFLVLLIYFGAQFQEQKRKKEKKKKRGEIAHS
jgi:hypothetical protein